ncbi:hypothetical protein QUF63_00810 [Anaerolineales bacterium HSG25]|nr:hypothetical protein [Anaerolineales bacterium HSG25]
MRLLTEETQLHWLAISPLFDIRNDDDYDRAIRLLNQLLDDIGTNEQHPLYGLLDTLGTLVQVYEENHLPMPLVSGGEALQFLMTEHDLKATDLPELGLVETVTAILNGQRELTITQIRWLAQRFGVSPAVFV